jgi:autotransporter-associated beta strand protein
MKIRGSVGCLLATCLAGWAADGVWQGGASGSWSNPANWSGAVPGGGGIATFTGGAGAIVTNDAGTVTLAGMNANTDVSSGPNVNWFVRGGAFELVAPALFTTGYPMLDLKETVLKGSADVTVTGPGRLHFGFTNELTGRIVVSNGNLYVMRDGGYGAAPAAHVPDAIVLDGGNLGNGDGGINLTNHPNRGITLRAGGGFISVGNVGREIRLAAPITGPGALNINLEASAAVLGNPANDYAGDTAVGTAGLGHNGGFEATLKLGSDEVIPHGAGKGDLVVAPVGSYQTGARGAKLDLAGRTETVNTLNAGPKATITSTVPGAGRLVTGGLDGGSELRGIVSGGVTIEKQGTGTLTAIGATVADATLDLREGTLVAGGANLGYGSTVRFDGGGMTLAVPSGFYEFSGASASGGIQLDAPLTYTGWNLWPEKGANWSSPAANWQYVYRARWYVPPEQAGDYSFAKGYDDGAYLRIDDTVVISNTVPGVRLVVQDVPVAAGWHDLELRFLNINGGAVPMHGFRSGLIYDPANSDISDAAEVAAAKVFSDDGGPNLRAAGAPNELRGRLLLAQDATLTVPADAEPFVLGGAVTAEPDLSPEPVLTVDNGGAPLVFGSSGANPAVLDAPVAASGGLVLTNRVWLRRVPQGTWSVAPGADIALDGAALLGDADLVLTDRSVRVVRGDSIGGSGAVTVNPGTKVWFDTMRFEDGRLTNTASAAYDNAVTLAGGEARFTGKGTVTYTGTVTGSGSVVKDDTGTLIFDAGAGSAIGGEILVQNGRLVIPSEASLGGTSAVRLPAGASNAEIANADGEDLTLDAVPLIFHTGGLRVQGASATFTVNTPMTLAGMSKLGLGKLVLGGDASNTGLAPHLREGSLDLNKGGSAFAVQDLPFAITGTLVRITGESGNQINRNLGLNGGTLDLNGHDEGIAALTNTPAVTGKIVNNGAQAATLTVGEGNATSGPFAGTLEDGTAPLALTKTGTGALALPYAALAYSGATRVEGGTLRVGAYTLPEAGLTYRLDATDAAALTLSDGFVAAWADSSGKGFSFVSTTPEQRPTYVADGINGKPAVRFSDTARNRIYTTKSGTYRTVFIVCRMTSHMNLAGIWGQSGADKGIRAKSLTSWQHTTNGGNANDFTDQGQMFINGVQGTTFAQGAPHILTAVSSSNQTWPTALGDYWGNATNVRYFRGFIGEVLVYDRALDDATRQEVEAYLTAKWFTGRGQTLATPFTVAESATLSLAAQDVTLASLAGGGRLAPDGGTVWLPDYAAFTGTVVGACTVSLAGSGNASFRPNSLDTAVRNDGAAPSALEVRTAGSASFVGSLHDGASALGLTQSGAGTTYYAGTNSAYTGPTRIEAGTAVVAGGALAQWVRFAPQATRPGVSGPPDHAGSGFQISEFRLTLGGAELPYPAGTLGTCPVMGPGTEGPDKAVDGDVSTKFYINRQPLSVLVVQLPGAVQFDGYRWYTANDAPGRDPVAWKVEVSDDGATWTAVDERDFTADLAAVTTSRRTLAGTWGVAGGGMAMDIFSDVSATTVAAPGTLAVIGAGETVGPLSGDGAVRLVAGGWLGINAFADAAFAGGIGGTGTVVKAGAATQSLSGALAFKGSLIVEAGTLDLTGATLTGVTNIVIRSGAELTGAAAVAGGLTVIFESGGAYSGSLAVSGALKVEGPVTLAVPEGAAYPYTGTLFTYASADAATREALRAAVLSVTPPAGHAATVRVTDGSAVLTVAPSGTVLMLQ